jgi:hypothetical protein
MHIFSYIWKIDTKDKYTQNKHVRAHIYVESRFGTLELLYGTWERMEGKENDSESTVSKYVASVQVDDIMIHTESR